MKYRFTRHCCLFLECTLFRIQRNNVNIKNCILDNCGQYILIF